VHSFIGQVKRLVYREHVGQLPKLLLLV
jgi:hypothetical protein